VISPIPPTYTGFYKGEESSSEKKIVRNVFEQGDAYFSFGDILFLDKDYYVYFRDRVGDTFRYKIISFELFNSSTCLFVAFYFNEVTLPFIHYQTIDWTIKNHVFCFVFVFLIF